MGAAIAVQWRRGGAGVLAECCATRLGGSLSGVRSSRLRSRWPKLDHRTRAAALTAAKRIGLSDAPIVEGLRRTPGFKGSSTSMSSIAGMRFTCRTERAMSWRLGPRVRLTSIRTRTACAAVRRTSALSDRSLRPLTDRQRQRRRSPSIVVWAMPGPSPVRESRKPKPEENVPPPWVQGGLFMQGFVRTHLSGPCQCPFTSKLPRRSIMRKR